MSKRDQPDDPQRQMGGKEIADSIHRAQAAMNQYDVTRKQLATRNENPNESPALFSRLIELDAAVHDAYARLRKYIRKEAEDDWWNSRILAFDDDNIPIVLGGPPDEKITIDDDEFDIHEEVSPEQVKFIEDFQGEVIEETEERWVQFEGWVQETNLRPAMMPPEAYRTAIQYLEEIRNDIGFTPEAASPPNNTEISEEMIEEVEEWRQQNL